MTKSLHFGTVAAFCMAFLGAAAAQSSTKYRSVEVGAGKLSRLGPPYVNVPEDCSAASPPEVTVIKPPGQGEVSTQDSAVKAGTIKRCPSLAAKAKIVAYKAPQDFKGSDEVTYEVKFANGKVDRHVIKLNTGVSNSKRSGR